MMTDKEAIEAVRLGRRCQTPTTMHTAVSEDSWKCPHRWRAVACDGDTDVIECQDCGRQRLAKCDFDDECS